MKNKLDVIARLELDCRILAKRVGSETRKDVRNFIMEDMAYKTEKLLSLGYEAGRHPSKEDFDIGIVSVIGKETFSILPVFGIDAHAEEYRNIDGIRVWRTKVTRSNPRRELSVLLIHVAQRRNVNCAIACMKIFSFFNLKACILAGIAGGVKEKKVRIPDVIGSTLIIDYEHQRLQKGGGGNRPTPQEPPPIMLRNLENFEPSEMGLKEDYERLVMQRAVRSGDNAPVRPPEFHPGVILSGDKLMADGKLSKRSRMYHQQVLAVEMEGAGFGGACKAERIPWLVFRGVSDYGNPRKNKNFQSAAALAAGLITKKFIEHDIRLLDEVEFSPSA